MLTFSFCHAIYNLFWSDDDKDKNVLLCLSLILYLITCPIAQSSKDIWFSLMVQSEKILEYITLDLNTVACLASSITRNFTAFHQTTAPFYAWIQAAVHHT